MSKDLVEVLLYTYTRSTFVAYRTEVFPETDTSLVTPRPLQTRWEARMHSPMHWYISIPFAIVQLPSVDMRIFRFAPSQPRRSIVNLYTDKT